MNEYHEYHNENEEDETPITGWTQFRNGNCLVYYHCFSCGYEKGTVIDYLKLTRWHNGYQKAICPKCLSELKNMKYNEYLFSSTWYGIRKNALQWYSFRCQECYEEEDKHLHVHHKTYERLGEELIDDLIVLCKECHAEHHELPTNIKQLDNDINRTSPTGTRLVGDIAREIIDEIKSRGVKGMEKTDVQETKHGANTR